MTDYKKVIVARKTNGKYNVSVKVGGSYRIVFDNLETKKGAEKIAANLRRKKM